MHYSLDIFEELAQEAGRLARYNKKVEIDHFSLDPNCSSFHLLMPVELAKFIFSGGAKAVTKLTSA
jgi:hypothetical protein